MEELLALARKAAGEAEVFEVDSEEVYVQFETNRLKHIQTRQSRTTALRVIKDGRIGFALTSGAVDPASLVASAVETAQFGMAAKFDFPANLDYPGVEIYDPAVRDIPLDDMINLGEALIAAVRRDTPELICEGGVARGIVSMRLMNSRGASAGYTKSIYSLGAEANLIRGTDMLFVGDSESSCRPIKDSSTVADSVLGQLERARELAKSPAGELPVVLTPHGVAGVLVPSLMAGFNGKTVLEGASPIGNKLGQLVFDKNLSLRDEPLIPYRPQSRPCDDEGTPSHSTPLIQEGIVYGFLYDLQTAALAGTHSTGHGSRGRGGLPAPSPSAFVISPGQATLAEMVADIKEGLVIEQVLGAEQGNVLGGDFSGNVLLGYKIENGRFAGRVKNTMITGNIYRVLKDLGAIGSESRWVNGYLSTPPLYLPRLSVASK